MKAPPSIMPTKYMVTKATPRKDVVGLDIAGKQMLFGEKTNSFEVSDAGVAKEIEAAHGGKRSDVVVTPHHVPAERGHKYFFGQMPEMPWKKVTNE